MQTFSTFFFIVHNISKLCWTKTINLIYFYVSVSQEQLKPTHSILFCLPLQLQKLHMTCIPAYIKFQNNNIIIMRYHLVETSKANQYI